MHVCVSVMETEASSCFFVFCFCKLDCNLICIWMLQMNLCPVLFFFFFFLIRWLIWQHDCHLQQRYNSGQNYYGEHFRRKMFTCQQNADSAEFMNHLVTLHEHSHSTWVLQPPLNTVMNNAHQWENVSLLCDAEELCLGQEAVFAESAL